MEVSGAFITPDMTPAMPTSVNDTMGTSQWNSALQTSASVAPVNPPTNNDGANVPPTPPDAVVAAIATVLKSIVATMKRMTTQSMWLKR